MTIYWFRFEEQRYAAPLDEFDRPAGRGRMVLHLRKLKVLRETPKGVQLIGGGHGTSNPRLVLHDSHKKFACATREEAWLSFVARKNKQIAIYKARISDAEEAMTLGCYADIERDW